MVEQAAFRQVNPHSMTGFGRGQASSNQVSVQVELRSLNNKYLDIRPKVPRAFSFWEPQLRSRIAQAIRRGTVDAQITYQLLDSSLIHPINETALKAYATSIQEFADRFGIPSGLNLTSLLRLPGALNIEEGMALGDNSRIVISELLEKAFAEAAQDLLTMRGREGAAIIEILGRELDFLATTEKTIRARVPQLNERLMRKIRDRVMAVTSEAGRPVDEGRLIQEVAFYVDRSDVTEEVDRLKSHTEQFRTALANKSNFTIGKQLDFLVQELLRESNTIGSKTDDLEITSCVVNLKLSLDRMREQIQNLE